jgi:multimeric flavodoxin WrbA
MTNKMKTLGIIGSPRRDGNSTYLIEEVLKNLSDNFEVETIFLKDYDIKPCEECYFCAKNDTCSINDGMQTIYPKLKESKVIILSSPIFMGGVTSRMRAFMERTWHLRKGQLKGKIGTYIIVGRRDIGSGVNEMEEFLSRLNLTKIPGIIGYGFQKGEISNDEEALKNALKLVNQINDLRNI